MRDTSTTRKTFLKGLGLAALATAFFPRSASQASEVKGNDEVKLPMAARKAPMAVARGKTRA
jgi:hypothetical protein